MCFFLSSSSNQSSNKKFIVTNFKNFGYMRNTERLDWVPRRHTHLSIYHFFFLSLSLLLWSLDRFKNQKSFSLSFSFSYFHYDVLCMNYHPIGIERSFSISTISIGRFTFSMCSGQWDLELERSIGLISCVF